MLKIESMVAFVSFEVIHTIKYSTCCCQKYLRFLVLEVSRGMRLTQQN